MTKKLLFGMMAATMLCTTSCESDIELANQAGETSTVSFNVGTPEKIVSRAFSDGLTATRLQYAVYDAEGNEIEGFTVTDGSIQGSTTVNLQLTTGKTYSVAFWATAPDAPYTVDFTNKTMQVNYEGATSNAEKRDAFYKYETFTVTGAMTKTIELKRPFAQLNIGTSDLKESAATGYTPTQSWVSVPVYTTLNFANGAVTGQQARKFDLAALPQGETFPVDGYDYLSMNYLLVAADKEVVDVEFGFTDGTTAMERKVGSVPVQRNYRTNIYGQLLTSNVNINVEIEPDYEDPDYNYPSTAAQELMLAATTGGIVTLSENVTLDASLNVTADMVINLNGKTITNKAENTTTDVIVVEKGATLTINGDGNVTAVSGNDGYAIIAKGKVVINGGTYRAGLDKNNDGNCTVYARDAGEVYIHGGTFITPEGDDEAYIINKKDADRATTTILVDGGTFTNFNPGNNPAEGPNTSFVAPGYHAVKSGDNSYIVLPETIDAVASTADELTTAIAEGKNVMMMNDITVPMLKVAKDVNIDANDNKIITSENYGIQVTASANVTISNAEIVINKAGDANIYAAGVKIENGDYTEKEINLNNCVVKMANNDFAYAINVPQSVKNLELNINNSTLEGAIAVQIWGKNNNININDSELICNYNTNSMYGSSCVALQNDGSAIAENNNVAISGCDFLYSGVNNYKDSGIVIYSVVDRNYKATTGANKVTITNCTYGEGVEQPYLNTNN